MNIEKLRKKFETEVASTSPFPLSIEKNSDSGAYVYPITHVLWEQYVWDYFNKLSWNELWQPIEESFDYPAGTKIVAYDGKSWSVFTMPKSELPGDHYQEIWKHTVSVYKLTHFFIPESPIGKRS
jgi:hypothetical protein